MSATRGVRAGALRSVVLATPYECGPTIAGPGCGGRIVPPDHCHLCHLPGATTLDHLMPVVLGGLTIATNLRAAHWSCNSQRGARIRGARAALVGVW